MCGMWASANGTNAAGKAPCWLPKGPGVVLCSQRIFGQPGSEQGAPEAVARRLLGAARAGGAAMWCTVAA